MVSLRAATDWIRFGAFTLDVRSGELTTPASRVLLQDQPLKILLRLLERPGALVSRDDLRQDLWPSNTFVDFEHGLNAAVKRLRDALGDSAEAPRFIETLPRRGYRFIAPVESDESSAAADAPVVPRMGGHRWLLVIVVGVLGASAALGWRAVYHPALRPPILVLFADVENRTGEPVLTGTMKQALAVKLSESHVIDFLSDERVRDTLRTMRRSPDALLTAAVAQEVCQRAGATAMLTGAISPVGSAYAIALTASSCATGDIVARDQAQAPRREDILAAADAMAVRVRRRLGESASAVGAANTRLERATTASLDALKAFTEGEARFNTGVQREAIPFYRRAIDLDPDFAMAHAKLGVVYFNLTIPGGVQELTRAFELRERLTEREQFYVTAHYQRLARVDLEASRAVYEVWKSSYPRDPTPYNSLGLLYARQGRFDRALGEFDAAVHIALPTGLNYSNLVDMYLHAGRIADAMHILEDWERQVGVPLHYGRLLVAIQRRDFPTAEQHAAALRNDQDGVGNADAERARTAAIFGRMTRARDLFDAAAGEGGSDLVLDSAILRGEEAIWEAETGDCSRARARVTDERVARAGAMEQGQLVRGLAAIALAACGEVAIAERLTEGVSRPALLGAAARARIDLARGRLGQVLDRMPSSPAADLAGPLGYAYAGQSHGLVGAYLRGRAYLGLGEAGPAAAEFQKIVDHPGVAAFAPYQALAPLYLARAYAAARDLIRSRSAYERFLQLWKHADADLPILCAAQREYDALTKMR